MRPRRLDSMVGGPIVIAVLAGIVWCVIVFALYAFGFYPV